MKISKLMLYFLWFLYCFLHSFLAINSVKMFFYKCFGFTAAFYRIIYNLISIVLLAGMLYIHLGVSSIVLYQTNPFIQLTSILLGLAGGSIMMVCISKYFKQMSGLHAESKKVNLQTNGVHKWVRHPLYLGTILFLIATVMYWPSVKNMFAAIIVILYTVTGIFLEEKKLMAQFGDEYRKYQKKVPMIIPKLKF